MATSLQNHQGKLKAARPAMHRYIPGIFLGGGYVYVVVATFPCLFIVDGAYLYVSLCIHLAF
jgi:hypothetical protein